MGKEIGKKDVLSEYSTSLAYAIRNNKDGTIVVNRPFSYEADDGNSGHMTKSLKGGIVGFSNIANISEIAKAGVKIVFKENDKKDEVTLDLSGLVDSTAATVDAVVAKLNTALNVRANFPNIGHGFNAYKDTDINRLRVDANIPIVIGAGDIPLFDENEEALSLPADTVSITEGENVSDDFTVTGVASGMKIDTYIVALNTAFNADGATLNTGHTYVATKEKDTNGVYQVKITSAVYPEWTFLFSIEDYIDPDGLADYNTATVLELNRSFVRSIRKIYSITSSADTTDSETKSNDDGKGTVTTIATEQSTTGYSVTLEDSERNPINATALCGGYYDAVSGLHTPKKSDADSPLFSLIVFSSTFGEGNFSEQGYDGGDMDIYPSCTAVIENNDKANQDFNHDVFTITANDNMEMPAGSRQFISIDRYNTMKAAAAQY